MKYARLSRPLLFAIASLVALPVSCQHYKVWRNFNSNNGLPQNSVVCMAVDTAGYVWIGTEGGLVRYDGGAMRTFDLKGYNSLPSKRISNIIPTAKGEIMVEDVHGNIFSIHGHLATMLELAGRKRSDHVGGMPSTTTHLSLSKPGAPYLDDATMKVLVHAYSTTEWVMVAQDTIRRMQDTMLVSSVAVGPSVQQTIFLGDLCIGLAADGKAYRINTRTGALSELAVHGSVVVATPSWPKFHWYEGQTTAYCVWNGRLVGLRMNEAEDGLNVDQQSLDLPISTGITRILQIPSQQVILIGTQTNGLYVLRPEVLQASACAQQKAYAGSVFGQSELKDGSLLIAAGKRVFRIHGSTCGEVEALQGASPYNLVQDPDGWIWCSRGPDLIRYDPATGSQQEVLPISNGVIAIRSYGDSILIGTEGSIQLWRNGNMQHLANITAATFQDWPSVLAVDHRSRLIYGTDHGAYVQHGMGSPEFFFLKGVENTDVRAIERISDMILVGTYGNGWYAVVDDQAIRLPNDPLNCLDYAHSFVLRDGVLWISTNRGLIRTTLNDIRTFLANSGERPYLARYGTAAGLMNLEFNGGCNPPVLTLKNGRLSYPTIEGVVSLDPRSIADPYPQGDPIQGFVRVNGKKWNINNYLELDPDVSTIEFDFSMAYWGELENAQLEYRISGIVDEWMMLPIGKRTIDLVRPPPGGYVVELRKVGSTTRGIKAPPFFGFVVRRPIWASWPAFIAYAAGTMLLLIMGMKLNTARLRKRNRWLEENVAAQTEALLHANQELRTAVTHQENLINVISHDVVPPLRFVARVAHSAEQLLRDGKPGPDLAETLADLSTSTEKLHANAESLLTWIRTRSKQSGPEYRTIAVHAFMEHSLDRVREMLEQAGIGTTNEVDTEDLVTTDGDLLGVMVHNLLMNVHAHARAQHLRVQGIVMQTGYEIRIIDDGIGMPSGILAGIENELNGRSQLGDRERKGPATGLGFVIIAECIRQLNGRLTLQCAGPGLRVNILLPHHTDPG